ncbi:MAG: hypothetical protein ABWJ97_04345 [Thermoproteus sp.]
MPATTISVPTRYVHSPVEVLRLEDAVNAARLLAAVLEESRPEFVESLMERKIK